MKTPQTCPDCSTPPAQALRPATTLCLAAGHPAQRLRLSLLALALAAWAASPRLHAAAAHAAAATPAHEAAAPDSAHAGAKPSTKTLSDGQIVPENADVAAQLRQALSDKLGGKKKLTLVVSDKAEPKPSAAAHSAPKASTKGAAGHAAAADHAAEPASTHATATPAAHAVAARPRAAAAHSPAPSASSRDELRARAAALAGHGSEQIIARAEHVLEPTAGHASGHTAHWSYSGETGPAAWGKLQADYASCANGQRQSPINIEDSATLQGPAEPLQFRYTPSGGVVVNNGHTVQVDVQGDNSLTVRGQVYRLAQMHFHSPSEEQINFRSFALVAHLVHKSADGQLAVVAVLFEPGAASPVIDTVWTYMPLDVNDRVRLPYDSVNLSDLLPKDQRYYQFMGSLTTPPCTEGVLWMVMKQPVSLSAAQLRLFQQLYPNNARPVQPLNARPVRSAM